MGGLNRWVRGRNHSTVANDLPPPPGTLVSHVLLVNQTIPDELVRVPLATETDTCATLNQSMQRSGVIVKYLVLFKLEG